MKRSQSLVFRLLIAAFAVAFLGSVAARLQAQIPPAPPAPAAKAAPGAEEEENPFAAQPEIPLPPGMTGSTTNHPRVGLKPGLYDAGEAAMGIKHLAFLKKGSGFQMSSTP